LNPDTACSRRWQRGVAARSSTVLLVCLGAALASVSGSSSAIWAVGKKPSFAQPQRYATTKFPEAVAIGDLDGDGRGDLVTAGSNRQAVGSVSVLLNRGGGAFGAARAYRTGFGSRSVVIGDLNGDERLDLATANFGGHSVSVLLNRGGGRFGARVDYRAGRNPQDIAIGDLNGDGNAELVTANTNTSLGGSVSSVSVLMNDGDGTFRETIELRPGRRPVSVAIGDLNGDGNPDLATANRSDTISVFINRGDASFRPRVDYRAGSGPNSIAIGDLNGDRRQDLITANNNTVGGEGGGYVDSVSVLLNRGNAGFRPKVDYAKTGKPELPTLGFGSVAVGDLNGDRKSDVAIGNAANRVCVFVNSGSGRLQPRIDYRTWPTDDGWGPRSLAIGHLNGDRKFDVVTVKFASVAVLFNRTRA
jgi:VCBS repeat protein/FG-GAP repeat protein